ncbi:MAG: hypothetical protein AVDCRST_MAG93-2417 [uncultured Chloroflexia bacterium]|uniref:Uncharacterized protein n=1 Tax=uncultured Chloroflexia bacterium TaxID=1672391 RepID=A0A6J4IZF4_9CHLR|nr:MAG: hypothetical protein AVDCRST_MAG93-2417 [uncultured Chloroflexia bacterium]
MLPSSAVAVLPMNAAAELPSVAVAVLPLAAVAVLSLLAVAELSNNAKAALPFIALALLPPTAAAWLSWIAMALEVASESQVLVPFCTLVSPFWLTHTLPAAIALLPSPIASIKASTSPTVACLIPIAKIPSFLKFFARRGHYHLHPCFPFGGQYCRRTPDFP